jgi:hypothetical protein
MTTTTLASIGIDIGKEVFHVFDFGTDGKIALSRKIKRLALLEVSTASRHRRHGGLSHRALCQPYSANFTIIQGSSVIYVGRS